MDKQSGKDLTARNIRSCCGNQKKTICSISRASTVWGATSREIFGALADPHQRTKASTSWSWICRCSIPGAAKTLMGTFLSDIVLQVLSFVAGERARHYPAASSRRHRRSRRPRASALGGSPKPLGSRRLSAVETRRDHRDGSRKGMRNAAVHVPLPGGALQICRMIMIHAFLQECVLSCKNAFSMYTSIVSQVRKDFYTQMTKIFAF